MWVTHSEPNRFYQTRAESHGATYVSRLEIEERDGGVVLEMSFEGESTGKVAKPVNCAFGLALAKSIRKAIDADLRDIKFVCEQA